MRSDRCSAFAVDVEGVRAVAVALDHKHVAAWQQARLHQVPPLAAVARPVGLADRELAAGHVVEDAEGPRRVHFRESTIQRVLWRNAVVPPIGACADAARDRHRAITLVAYEAAAAVAVRIAVALAHAHVCATGAG